MYYYVKIDFDNFLTSDNSIDLSNFAHSNDWDWEEKFRQFKWESRCSDQEKWLWFRKLVFGKWIQFYFK